MRSTGHRPTPAQTSCADSVLDQTKAAGAQALDKLKLCPVGGYLGTAKFPADPILFAQLIERGGVLFVRSG